VDRSRARRFHWPLDPRDHEERRRGARSGVRLAQPVEARKKLLVVDPQLAHESERAEIIWTRRRRCRSSLRWPVAQRRLHCCRL